MIERINIGNLRIAEDAYPLSAACSTAEIVRMRIYWGCTTFGCERGFYADGVGSAEDMPSDWTYCPACGGELAEIKSLTPDSEFRP